jgi:aminoglycoside 3-N-acetyltransferase
MVKGKRQWVTYQTLDYDADDFEQVGAALASAGLERSGEVGAAPARLLSVVAMVDFAQEWFRTHRTWRDTSTTS